MLRKAGLLLLGATVIALAGCASNDSGDPTGGAGLTADQASVQLSIAAAPELANDGLFDAGTSAGFSSRPGASDLSGRDGDGSPETDPSTPSGERHWWRSITSVTRSFDYEFTATDEAGRPTLAHVTVHKHLVGVLHVAWAESAPGPLPADSVVRHNVSKPLKDHWVRHLWFARVATDSLHEHPWRLVASSGVEVTSETGDEGPQPHIASVRVQAGEADTTFTDPAAAITWRKLCTLPQAAPVTLTVTTDAPDDIVVLMHRDNRVLMTANGDNTYTATFEAPVYVGLKHLGVNAISHATLFDAAGGYHSHAWLYPYVNRGEAYRD